MSEQDGSVQESTPAVAGPEGTPGTAEQAQQEIDWQDRYQHLQPEYTRVTQENAQLREAQELYDLMLSTEDPDTRRQVAEALGYELEQEQEDQDYDEDEDPFVVYDERLGRIEQSLSERDQEEADADYAHQVREVVDQQLDELGLDRDDQDWVLAYAINALPATEEGLPDIGQAFEVFQAREVERQRNWAKTKTAPRISPHGQPGTEAPNLDDRQERQDFILRRMMEDEQAQY